jgi:chemotaxis-related protein WspD
VSSEDSPAVIAGASGSLPSPAADGVGPPEIIACWNQIGVHGDGSCPELAKAIRCRNCPVYAEAGTRLLDRPPPPGYRRERTEHFARGRRPLAPRRDSAVLFRLPTGWFALPATAFVEIAEQRSVHALPHRKGGIVLGLVNIRGELMICVSLEGLLRADQHPAGPAPVQRSRRLLVTEWQGSRWVLAVCQVFGIHRFEANDLRESPATLGGPGLSLTQGVLLWQNQSVGLLDPDLLFSCLNRSVA